MNEVQAEEPVNEEEQHRDYDLASSLNIKRPETSKVKRKDLNKQDAFLEFKDTETGQMLESSIRDNRVVLKDMKVQVKDLTEKCNLHKKNIDIVKHELDKK